MTESSQDIWLTTDEIDELIGGLEHCAELATTIGGSAHGRPLVRREPNRIYSARELIRRAEEPGTR